MKVAVVRNHNRNGVIARFGQSSPESYGEATIEAVASALVAAGHDVLVCEGDKTLLETLEQFMPADPASGAPTGLVFNMAYGIQGTCRYTHVPAMLETAGIPYTGSSPLGHTLALDKVVTKKLIRAAGVPTPSFRVMRSGAEAIGDLRFPLIVKPIHESTSYGLQLVHDAERLKAAVRAVVSQFEQDALVEEYIDGREVCVALLGNGEPETLPLVEQDFGGRGIAVMTLDDKFHRRVDEPLKICPAPVEAPLAARLREVALATFRACHCRDYARVDIRIDRSGRPFVLEINSMASLSQNGSYMLAARRAGYDFDALVCRIVDVAHERYFGMPAPRDARIRASELVPVAVAIEQEGMVA